MDRKKWLIVAGAMFILILLIFLLVVPLAIGPRSELSSLAQDWQDSGEYIKWQSTIPNNQAFGDLNIFTYQAGDPQNPALIMIHGYPTSSFDFIDLIDELSDDYYIATLDTIGYGLSDKPLDGYDYSIIDDAKLVEYYATEVLNLTAFSILTHDKGSSVGFALLDLYRDQSEYTIEYHFITNGNIYLPLADLTTFQNVLLNPITGPIVERYITGDRLAEGLYEDYHTFPESQDKVDAVASIFDYQNGGRVQHELIQYLNERIENEDYWLEILANSTVPAVLIWGIDDTVAPVAVADYVWSSSLKDRETNASYWQLPNSHHYLQNDSPEVINLLIRMTFGEAVDFSNIPAENHPVEIEG